MNKELLRRRNNLVVSGTGIIALELWSVLKIIMMVIFSFDEIFADVLKTTEASKMLVIAVTVVTVGTIIGISLAVRLYVGRSAIAEGKGAKKGNGYLILTGILTAIDFAGLVMEIVTIGNQDKGILEYVALTAFDLTVVFSQIDTVVSALKVRKLSACSSIFIIMQHTAPRYSRAIRTRKLLRSATARSSWTNVPIRFSRN